MTAWTRCRVQSPWGSRTSMVSAAARSSLLGTVGYGQVVPRYFRRDRARPYRCARRSTSTLSASVAHLLSSGWRTAHECPARRTAGPRTRQSDRPRAGRGRARPPRRCESWATAPPVRSSCEYCAAHVPPRSPRACRRAFRTAWVSGTY